MKTETILLGAGIVGISFMAYQTYKANQTLNDISCDIIEIGSAVTKQIYELGLLWKEEQ